MKAFTDFLKEGKVSTPKTKNWPDSYMTNFESNVSYGSGGLSLSVNTLSRIRDKITNASKDAAVGVFKRFIKATDGDANAAEKEMVDLQSKAGIAAGKEFEKLEEDFVKKVLILFKSADKDLAKQLDAIKIKTKK